MARQTTWRVVRVAFPAEVASGGGGAAAEVAEVAEGLRLAGRTLNWTSCSLLSPVISWLLAAIEHFSVSAGAWVEAYGFQAFKLPQ